MTTFSSEVLVSWCRRTLPDDTRGFEALIAQYKGMVFATIYRMLGDDNEAEDYAQDVFVKVYRGITTLDDPALLVAWIRRITVNTCLDVLEKRQRRPVTVPLATAGGDLSDGPGLYATQRTPLPEQAALQQELRDCITNTFAQLDGPSRAALVLRDLDDRPYQEIADILTLGLSAVKMRIHRARLAFQQALASVCPDLARRVDEA
jgi:RNA polymerase sigma-70 factor (ECF subfamily)